MTARKKRLCSLLSSFGIRKIPLQPKRTNVFLLLFLQKKKFFSPFSRQPCAIAALASPPAKALT
jgi:hypothetical protein